jgi:hypothetical protein
LHPWIPEHAIFIRGELAKLEVTDPTAAASFKQFYEEKMDKYESEQPKEPEPVEVEKKEEQPEVVEVEKKKPGRKPKSLSQL